MIIFSEITKFILKISLSLFLNIGEVIRTIPAMSGTDPKPGQSWLSPKKVRICNQQERVYSMNSISNVFEKILSFMYRVCFSSCENSRIVT